MANEWRFPKYIELVENFDLDNPKNKDLKFQIIRMYTEYNTLYDAMRSMTPEKIKYFERLDTLLRDKYFSKLRIDELSFCLVDGQYNEILDLFENEIDKQEAVQRLFDIYMKDCANHFRLYIKTLLEVE